MSIVPYTKLQLIQRIRKYLNDGFINSDFSISDREIMLHIDQSLAFRIVGMAYDNAKIEGVLVVAEAFLITYNLGKPTQDIVTLEWVLTLPQPPLSLPLGYSVTRVYTPNSLGVGEDFFPIASKRVGYRRNLPTPTGTSYRVENSNLYLKASNNRPLNDSDIYVQMPSSRTDDMNASMALPDDVIDYLFNSVIQSLIRRYAQPKDIINDSQPAGNNNVKTQ